MSKILSKSRLMRGVQCEKNLWLSLHKPDLEAKADAATQMQFDEGNAVGELAREHEGPGVLIDVPYYDYALAHKKTEQAIKEGQKVIYEASFLVGELFARADILKKDKNGWHLVEVKKSTSVKDYHIADSAIQAHIIELTGLKLKSISIRFINNEITYPDLKKLFSSEDVTKLIRDYQKNNLAEKLSTLQKVSKAKTEPKKQIGPHCSDPFDCPFIEYCWKSVPKNSVFNLPTLTGKQKWKLYDSGLKSIHDLKSVDFKNLAQRAIEVTQSEKIFIDQKKIAKHLAKWQFPLYFFDFETIGPAIPRYSQTKPYTQIPFQFSCHILKSKTSKKIEHFEYLHTDEKDPRPHLIQAMLKGLGTEGSIVAYNKSFEIGVIKKLAEFDSKNKKKLLALVDRFVDPLPIFKECVYHYDFLGSFSIKAVAPALVGKSLSYAELEIGNGSDAQVAANQIMLGKIVGPELKKVVEALLIYCRQDTMAMVELVKWLWKNQG